MEYHCCANLCSTAVYSSTYLRLEILVAAHDERTCDVRELGQASAHAVDLNAELSAGKVEQMEGEEAEDKVERAPRLSVDSVDSYGPFLRQRVLARRKTSALLPTSSTVVNLHLNDYRITTKQLRAPVSRQ